MAKSPDNSSSNPGSGDQSSKPAVPQGQLDDVEVSRKSYYFINEIVEDKLRRYISTGCTEVKIRDSIMEHASELIRQIIRKQGFQNIYPGQEESSFGDLLQVAYVQIERTLYKFRASPHCRKCFNPSRPSDSLLHRAPDTQYGIISFKELAINYGMVRCPKCKTELSPIPEVEACQGRFGGSITILWRGNSKVFNMWSQVAKTVILAYIKKEGRDRKNAPSYMNHVDMKPRLLSNAMDRFLEEAREICKYNPDYLEIIDAMIKLLETDDKPYDAMVQKLIDMSNHSKAVVAAFLKFIRIRGTEFTDSPINRKSERKISGKDDPDEDSFD